MQDVAYRPGFPTVEQILEHEERTKRWCAEKRQRFTGGWWMGMFTGQGDRKAPQIYRLFVNERGEIRRANEAGDDDGMPVSSHEVMRRPCWPEGTPCSWLSEKTS